MSITFPLTQWLFPDHPLEFVDILWHPEGQQVSISTLSQRLNVACPQCQTHSSSVHSHYTRTLSHLPWCGQNVQLVLRVRRFRCKEKTCLKRIFCEPVEGIAQRYARMTRCLTQNIQNTALLVGGAMGCKVGSCWGASKSRNTSLRTLRRMIPPPRSKAVKRIGVDDFAFKKGSKYGTLIIDLDSGNPSRFYPTAAQPP